MHGKPLKIGAVLLTLVLVLSVFSACATETQTPPEAVTLRTDLHDAVFTFTYGELKPVMPPEILSALYENFEEKDDSTEIQISYYDLKARCASAEDKMLFQKVLELLDAQERSALAENQSVVLDYYTRIANALKTQKPAVVYTENIWVEDDTISFTGADGRQFAADTPLCKGAKLYKDMLATGLSAVLPTEATAAAGTDLTDILYLKGRDTVTALDDTDVTAIYSSVSEKTEPDAQDNPVVTELTRTVEIHVRPERESVEKAMDFRAPETVLQAINRPENPFTVSDYSLTPQALLITAVFDAATDTLVSLTYEREMQVAAAITGEGDLAVYGSGTLFFTCVGNMQYQFSAPET